MVVLTNAGSSPCSLSGYPTSLVGVHADGRRRSLSPSHGTQFDTQFAWPADLRPGQSGRLGIATWDACPAAQVPGGLSNPAHAYTGEVVGLPGGGTVRADAPFDAVCGVGVTTFGSPEPQPSQTGAYPGLQAKADLPATAVAGTTLNYTVTLTNTGDQPVNLVPCPVYSEIINTGTVHSYSYRLNCSTVQSIAAGDSVTYAMRIPVPTGHSGIAKFGWSIPNSATAFAGTTLTITGRDGTKADGAPLSTPAGVVTAYYEAAAHHDSNAAAALLAPEIRSQYSDFSNLVSLTDLGDIHTAVVPAPANLPSGYSDITQVAVTYTATFKKVIAAGNGTQTRFVYVGRRTASDTWRILSIGTGP